jgi:serine/threonine-protein kinase
MGCVWLARDLKARKGVVLKVMHPHIAADPKFRERFERETALMAQLQHPNAVAFLAASVDEEHGPFIVMEYVAGQSLDKILARQRRFAPARLLRLLRQFCDVLQAAHEQHIIHCDLKPGNLMVVDFDTLEERLKVMDFGLARLGEAAGEGRTAPAEFAVGTPGYMSPEQVRGEPVDLRGDLYSVGAILYRLLTGRMPFEGATPMEILLAQATGSPTPFVDLNLSGTPSPMVEEVVRWCLAPDPADRPGSAQELFAGYEAAVALEYENSEEVSVTQTAVETVTELPTHVRGIVRDTVVEQMNAWMPEQIAVFKLQGFAAEVGGEIVRSVPGLVRVEVKDPDPAEVKASGLMSWLRRGRKVETQPKPPPSGVEVELRLRHADPEQPSLLQVTVLLRPLTGAPRPPDFLDRCRVLQQALRSFLMVNE